MVKQARWVILATMLLSSCQTHFVGGWLPWFSSSRSAEIAAIGAHPSLFNEVSLFWYGAHGAASPLTIDVLGNASTSPAALDSSAAALKAQGLLVIPTIADGTSPGVMRTVLLDPTTRAAHEDQIVNLVQSKGYDGIDLDYEVFAFGDHTPSFDPKYSPAWVAFVNELADKLHAKGKLLAVTVPAVWQTQGLNAPITHGYTFYAQDLIKDKIDRLRLMVYDWSVSIAGPMAPMFWVNEVIDYSTNVAKVPPSKLQLGVPAYGRQWATQKYPREFCPVGAVSRSSITMKAAVALAAAKGQTPVRDPKGSGEMTFSWDDVVTGPSVSITPPIVPTPSPMIGSVATAGDLGGLQVARRLTPPSAIVSCTLHHVAFYPDAASVQQRAQAAMSAGWRGIFIWALGYETSDVYTALANVGP